jgi:hypothetical protein
VDAFRPIGPSGLDGQFGMSSGYEAHSEYGVPPGDEDGDPAESRWRRGRDRQDGRRRSRGILAGGTAGFLAAAMALGAANLAAAFVRPQASPIIAVGEAFIDRTPPALKNFAIQKFGENDKNALLLGLYVTIAFIAIAIGVLAWRQVWAGVIGIGAFGAFGAFVAYTRPASQSTDVIPSLVGGLAGIIAIICLVRLTRHRASGGPEAFGGPRSVPARPEWPGGAGWEA